MSGRPGACRSCGAPIRWAETTKGKRMPLDFEPNGEGNVEIVGGIAIVHPGPDLFGGERFMPHHATCPDAEAWRRDESAPPTAPSTNEEPATSERLGTQLERVRVLMADGEWRTLAAIATEVGGSQAAVSARLRDLRTQRFGSHVVERRRAGPGLFEYRVRATVPA